MKSSVALAILTLVPALQTRGAPGPSPLQAERAQAAFVLGLGRTATPEEIAGVAATASIAELLAELQGKMRQDGKLAIGVAHKAWRDTLGSEPDTRAAAAPTGDALTYAALMQQHLQRLAKQPEEYRAVIDRAYLRAVSRAAYDIEHEYWAKHEVLPFMLLVACIENWAIRNQPGLMSTTGTPSIAISSGQITAVRVSPAVADEVRMILGRPLRADDPHGVARSQLVLAPGAAAIESIGGIHFVATGRPADRPND